MSGSFHRSGTVGTRGPSQKRDSAWAGSFVGGSFVGKQDVSPDALDQLILRIENGVEVLKTSQGNAVRSARAELNLVSNLDRVRDMMDFTLQGKNRELLKECWGGDSATRLITLHTLLNQIELKINPDQRRQDVVQRAANIEELLMDVGYAEEVRATRAVAAAGGVEGLHRQADEWTEAERAATFAEPGQAAAAAAAPDQAVVRAREEMVQDVLPKLANALVVGSQAVELEEEGKIAEAMEMYDDSYKALSGAITVLLAVVKFKASLGNVEELQEDVERLTRYQEQVRERVEYLGTVEEGTVPEVPVEEHIDPPQLSFLSKRTVVSSLLVAAGAIASTTGVILGGPFLGLLFAGVGLIGGGVIVAVTMAAGGGEEATSEDEKGSQ